MSLWLVFMFGLMAGWVCSTLASLAINKARPSVPAGETRRRLQHARSLAAASVRELDTALTDELDPTGGAK